MKDRVYNIKDELIDTLANSEETDVVRYFIDEKEVNLKFDYSRAANGQIEICFTKEED